MIHPPQNPYCSEAYYAKEPAKELRIKHLTYSIMEELLLQRNDTHNFEYLSNKAYVLAYSIRHIKLSEIRRLIVSKLQRIQDLWTQNKVSPASLHPQIIDYKKSDKKDYLYLSILILFLEKGIKNSPLELLTDKSFAISRFYHENSDVRVFKAENKKLSPIITQFLSRTFSGYLEKGPYLYSGVWFEGVFQYGVIISRFQLHYKLYVIEGEPMHGKIMHQIDNSLWTEVWENGIRVQNYTLILRNTQFWKGCIEQRFTDGQIYLCEYDQGILISRTSI